MQLYQASLSFLRCDKTLSLQVSDAGDVLYVLPSNFKQVIAGKSWLLRAEPFLQKVRDASAYLVRVTFGTALITSVVLVWVTIVAILSSSGKDDDRRLVFTTVCLGITPLCFFGHLNNLLKLLTT